ncbi:7,8-didemethyl-8-hydroxy-5-deazariboflavin synthase, CofG subunit [Rubidibacter lacunae KORDI 51-2]|uniref:7,8-didemethyl-8-hydroxy-5-deazariboflavin synthase n=1 Tax=Rubidibacter lacunae KORDI 51-2 TaxID=582515 RepID=U5DP00_9CHRO|nr:7,8-didemethyl-8-hydroxy-5-deazariboflavin synthase subunit CofG [Rubidibacter lacunae]ERN42334.1 7,8-didemethyl-8-hydroxy-5-deazariboflavin synthase, CofG subunit [Rubidibacter lacunae KORDI 51-2]
MSDRPRHITYSPAVTVVPTYECFNRCSYCNFRAAPGKDTWLDLNAARQELSIARASGVCEVLVLSGEVHPRSLQRAAWLARIEALCQLALELGLLPHTNVGPLDRAEMERLQAVNVSMGLMLEQLAPELLQTVHRHAPSKDPQVRLHQLDQAGELGIPFTTGLLLGIGETPADRVETLAAIAASQRRWGHVQEVILQPHSPGTRQEWQGLGFDLAGLPEVVAIARSLLPMEIAIQIPPNLACEPRVLLACLEAGATDLGGIGPKDEVNPDYAHLQPETLRSLLNPAGWELAPRLPVYPQYLSWLPPQLQGTVSEWQKRLVSEGDLQPESADRVKNVSRQLP